MWPWTIAPVINAAQLCLVVFSTALWCGHWIQQIAVIFYGKWKLHRKPSGVPPDLAMGVSILKPLTGIDPNLSANLETFFNMDYPTYEILFCVENELDPAIVVVETLMEKYPKIDAQILKASQQIGVNPKINNMIQGYKVVKYEYLLISDSGLKMLPDTLSDMVASLKDDVGLVHQMPFTERGRSGFAANLETVVFGTCHARSYLAAEFTGFTCLTGMSCLMRKSVLDEAGGLASLSQYLPEDYYIATAFIQRGKKMQISSRPALQNPSKTSVCGFQERMVRWARLRQSILPLTILFEPVSDCMVNGLLAAFSASVLFQWNTALFFAVHVFAWFICDYLLLGVIQNDIFPMSPLSFLGAWLFRELTCLYVVIKALCSSVIQWRHKTYLIKWGGVGEEIVTKISL